MEGDFYSLTKLLHGQPLSVSKSIRQNIVQQENLNIAFHYRWSQRYFYGWVIAFSCVALLVHFVCHVSAPHTLIGLAEIQIGWVAIRWLEDWNKAKEDHKIWLELFKELHDDYGLHYMSSQPKNRFDTVSIDDADKYRRAFNVKSSSGGEAS